MVHSRVPISGKPEIGGEREKKCVIARYSCCAFANTCLIRPIIVGRRHGVA